jgi:hypothetical protein
MDEHTKGRYEEERAAILSHIAASARAMGAMGEQSQEPQPPAAAAAKAATSPTPTPPPAASPAPVRGLAAEAGDDPSLSSASLDSAVAAAAEALRLDPDVSLRTSASVRDSVDMDVSASVTSL